MAKAKKEDILEKEMEETKEDKVVIEKPKTRRQLIQDLRKKRDSIDVELLNISTGGCKYVDKNGNAYFDLESGESVTIGLYEVQEVCNKAKKHFSTYELVIVDVYDNEYTLEDILMYLGLDDIYKNIDNYDMDYIEDLLLNYSDEELEKLIKIKDINFVKALASKAVRLNSIDGNEISRGKEKLFCSILNLDDLFPNE